jgi:hypothetical protein
MNCAVVIPRLPAGLRVRLSGGNYGVSVAGLPNTGGQQVVHLFATRFFAPAFFLATLPFEIFRASFPA